MFSRPVESCLRQAENKSPGDISGARQVLYDAPRQPGIGAQNYKSSLSGNPTINSRP
jgi:hypothetical protein